MRLSIIIPAFNVEKLIKKTLFSLIRQTERNFEVIIVNDGSTDMTLQIVNKIILEHKLTNFRVIDKENEGVSSARNIGLDEAEGTFVIFLDGDDYISLNLVETIYKALDNLEPDVLCWGYDVVNEDNTIIMKYFDKYPDIFTIMNGFDVLEKFIVDRTLHIWTGSAAYKKDILISNSIKYTEGCSNGEDQEFIIKSLLASEKVSFINQVLSFYVQREGSISRRYNIKRFDAISAMERAYEYIINFNDKNLETCSNFIRNEKIIVEFFYNYNSCFKYLILEKSLTTKEALRYIDNDLEKNYPGLKELIKLIMKDYKGENKKMFLRIKAFLFFPAVYYGLIKFKNKVS